jgi:hypothetical protein
MRSKFDPSSVSKRTGTNIHIPYQPNTHHDGHVRVLRTEGHETMPHILGPWFPRANDPSFESLYCASILALLKPWRNLTDLKEADQRFPLAYNRFITHASVATKRLISNIQYFHECSDKAKHEQEEGSATSQSTFATLDQGEHLDDNEESGDDDYFAMDTNTEEDRLISDEDILRATETSSTTREMVYADVAMNIAEEHGLFSEDDLLSVMNRPAMIASEENLKDYIRWQQHIEQVQETRIEEQSQISHELPPTAPFTVPITQNSGSTTVSFPRSAQLHDKIMRPPPSYLNEEQSMAFNIVSHHLYQHLLGKNPPQLLMIIHGQGGTGKTRLLQAITTLFSDMGCTNMLAKTALSGVAASQIGGKTLHSWATIPAGKGLPRTDSWIFRPSADSARRREENVHGKFLLSCDEMSLMTTDFLCLVSKVITAFRAGTVSNTIS